MLQKEIIIKSRKFDKKINKSWTADLIKKENSLLVFLGIFEFEINHNILGVIRPGTISYEFYWLDKWFNVFRFHEPDGEFRNFYCNINTPPTFENGILDYTDLDIDVIVWKDFLPIILDQDEFKENTFMYNYPDQILLETKSALDELLTKIEDRNFPFDSQPNIKFDIKT